MCVLLFLVCLYIGICECLLQINLAGVSSTRDTFGFPQYCASTCVRFGCTRNASCVDTTLKKNKTRRGYRIKENWLQELIEGMNLKRTCLWGVSTQSTVCVVMDLSRRGCGVRVWPEPPCESLRRDSRGVGLIPPPPPTGQVCTPYGTGPYPGPLRDKSEVRTHYGTSQYTPPV